MRGREFSAGVRNKQDSVSDLEETENERKWVPLKKNPQKIIV